MVYMEANERERKPLNRKAVIAAAVVATCAAIYLMMPSRARKEGAKATSRVPETEQNARQTVNAFENMIRTDDETALALLQATGQAAQPAVAPPPADTPVIDGDTLTYEGAIYVKIGYVKKKTVPDTVEIDGKRYVEIIPRLEAGQAIKMTNP